MNGHDLNRRAVESLIRAGCFDRMGYKRKALMQSVDRVLGGAASESRMNLTGQMNLFSAPDDGERPPTRRSSCCRTWRSSRAQSS